MVHDFRSAADHDFQWAGLVLLAELIQPAESAHPGARARCRTLRPQAVPRMVVCLLEPRVEPVRLRAGQAA